MAPKMNEKLADRIKALCLTERKSDVHFKLPYCLTNQNVTKCIPAHTFILTEISPPFEAMFSGNWTEAANGEVIEVPDVIFEAFEKLMVYVYKGEVEFSSMDIDLVIGLYYAAKKYEVTGLVDLCMEHFFFELKAKDSLRMLEYCLGKDEPVLRERSLQLIRGFSKEALESQAFLKAYKWAKHQCNEIEDPDKLRLELGPILDLIRFSTMDHLEFCRYVAPTHLLTEAEGYSILLKICSGVELQDKKVSATLSLKIAHFLHYLSPALYNLGNEFEWLSNGLEACGRLWKLSINLRGSNKNKEVAWPDNPPKYLSCHLYMLPIDGAVERRGEEQCGYHMYACIRIIKHTGDANENEVDFGAGGDLVRSFTHTYANRDSNKGVGWPRFATCEELLDPVNGYLSTPTGEHRPLEVVAKIVVKKTAPRPPSQAKNGGASA